jgi:hypothetical protein
VQTWQALRVAAKSAGGSDISDITDNCGRMTTLPDRNP